ncbi:MAG: C-GCAxxG-C-C family (seleno)protein [Clostridia bacterium]
MLAEIYKSGVARDLDLNCAETVVYITNLAYDLGLGKNSMKMASGFGGGMFLEEKCGAVTGAFMVLGCLYLKDRAHEDGTIQKMVLSFHQKFNEKMGSCECRPLKEKYRTPEKKCEAVIEASLAVLDEMILEHGRPVF